MNRLYYVYGVFLSKGSSVCFSNSIRKDTAETEVMKRLKQVLSKDRILKAIVAKINQKLVTRTVPPQAELSHISVDMKRRIISGKQSFRS
ncbi:hypothetical protein J2Z69_003376 [Paenibacillus shirakamiensis]|uniref:Uncharacterized protein n=1 Tax=Paenibacillus shirakamiensis TaxID=1265935 RepID=A0ABS4JNV3_9BACL|nr:hypothetical protein [Paenibacillus shirakamiensis]